MADVVDCRLTLLSKYFCFRSASSLNMAGSCRRCLFERPDPDELRRDLEHHLDRQERHNVEKWNFNFKSGRPMPGRIDWQVVDTVKRDRQNCGTLSLKEDRGDDDDLISGTAARLEAVATSTYSSQTTPCATATSPTQSSLTGGSASTVDLPQCPLPPSDASRRRGRNPPSRGESGKSKQSRHHGTRRRTIARRRQQLVSTAGAARVTGECLRIVCWRNQCTNVYESVLCDPTRPHPTGPICDDTKS